MTRPQMASGTRSSLCGSKAKNVNNFSNAIRAEQTKRTAHTDANALLCSSCLRNQIKLPITLPAQSEHCPTDQIPSSRTLKSTHSLKKAPKIEFKMFDHLLTGFDIQMKHSPVQIGPSSEGEEESKSDWISRWKELVWHFHRERLRDTEVMLVRCHGGKLLLCGRG